MGLAIHREYGLLDGSIDTVRAGPAWLTLDRETYMRLLAVPPMYRVVDGDTAREMIPMEKAAVDVRMFGEQKTAVLEQLRETRLRRLAEADPEYQRVAAEVAAAKTPEELEALKMVRELGA